MPLYRVFYNGPTEWEIEADNDVLAELKAYDRIDTMSDFHADEIEDEENEEKGKA